MEGYRRKSSVTAGWQLAATLQCVLSTASDLLGDLAWHIFT